MSAFIGDFLGFTLGKLHSSQLNITRVSNNDRYSENLTPNFTDSTAVVPGGSGSYYWGTNPTTRSFSIDFAFDDLRDEDIRRLKSILNFNGVQELIYDESSYKKYLVKCSSPPVIKYIPFSDLGDVINYKGEGTINLVAYYPYALSTNEIVLNSGSNTVINNVGDLATPFKIYFPISSVSQDITFFLNQNHTLSLENVARLANTDSYICIDTGTHLVEGVDSSYEKTGNLYNKFIISGDFFTLPTGQVTLIATTAWAKIKFNYLYY